MDNQTVKSRLKDLAENTLPSDRAIFYSMSRNVVEDEWKNAEKKFQQNIAAIPAVGPDHLYLGKFDEELIFLGTLYHFLDLKLEKCTQPGVFRYAFGVGCKTFIPEIASLFLAKERTWELFIREVNRRFNGFFRRATITKDFQVWLMPMSR